VDLIRDGIDVLEVIRSPRMGGAVREGACLGGVGAAHCRVARYEERVPQEVSYKSAPRSKNALYETARSCLRRILELGGEV